MGSRDVPWSLGLGHGGLFGWPAGKRQGRRGLLLSTVLSGEEELQKVTLRLPYERGQLERQAESPLPGAPVRNRAGTFKAWGAGGGEGLSTATLIL